MPKYWGKQIFTHGRFPKVGQKQKTERKEKERKNKKDRTIVITMAKLRMAHASTHGACMAHTSRLGQKIWVGNFLGKKKKCEPSI